MKFGQVVGSLLGLGICLISFSTAAESWQPHRLLEFTLETCRGWQANKAPAPGYGTGQANQSDIIFGEMRAGTRFRLPVDARATVELDVFERGSRPARFVGSLFNRFGDPLVLLALDSGCELQVGRQVNYNEKGQATSIVALDSKLKPRGEPDWLNPPFTLFERDRSTALKRHADAAPLRVGLVDSGVNYQLPEINRRLALDRDNRLIGYDFWEMDDLPFDAHPVNTGFFLQRHGTRTASLLLREAPAIELVPYRYPRPDMSRMRALIEHAAAHGVDILGMPLGSNRPQDWNAFERSAREHPDMLFVVSAGNDGRDIDARRVYPAALDLDNLLVVTSADDFLRPAQRTNWGRISVDYLLPAENLVALDFSGEPARVSGSSYAVARMTALAARIKMARRELRAADIVAELRRRYGQQGQAALAWVSSGYIADPLAGAPLKFEVLPPPKISRANNEAGLVLALDVLLLDPRWTQAAVHEALQAAYDILRQCGIGAGEISLRAFSGPDYLRDLSTGSAHTLLAAANTRHATVVFARDTRMQAQFTGEAFGLGNTRSRPWLANSLWLMRDVDDPGIALAHELYHLLANSGAHVEDGANLMQGRTRPGSTALTPQQCSLARTRGVANSLLD